MHVAARLADEPVGLRLGTIAQVGAGEMVGATHVSQASRPQAGQKKGFSSKLKDALS